MNDTLWQQMQTHPVWTFVIAMNVLGFLLMGLDKGFAIAHLWRIPEKLLFVIALFMGSVGIFLGMILFRNKTKKGKFRYGVPILLLLQGIGVYFVLTTNWETFRK